MNIEEKRCENTRNFLNSYYLQKDLGTVSGFDENAPMETSCEIRSAAIHEFDTDLKCGQVRLLAYVERITYVVLLHSWGDDAFVTTAFSHYDFPATDKEMALNGRSGLYLNVLQIWNTRTWRSEILRKSWLCGTLSEAVCRDAWNFWLSLTSGEKLPERILAASGTPVEDSDDIRWQYLREEKQVFAAVDGADPDHADQKFGLPSWFDDSLILPPLWQPKQEVLAARDEKGNIRKKCSIDTRQELLSMVFSPTEKRAWIKVLSPDMSDFSTALDGSEIIDARGKVLGVISRGRCDFAADAYFDGSVAIRLSDGSVCILTSVP